MWYYLQILFDSDQSPSVRGRLELKNQIFTYNDFLSGSRTVSLAAKRER